MVRHICHNKSEDHERCLVKMYKRYFELVYNLRCKDKGFYFQPYEDRFLYKNAVMGIHSLAKILPSLCDAIGVERRTSHCLRVTLASNLFNKNVDEKLIRERTGHTSNALFVYEKASKDKEKAVSSIVGPVKLGNKNVSDLKSGINGNSNAIVQSSSIDNQNSSLMPEFDFNFSDLDFLDDVNSDSMGMEGNMPSTRMGWNYCADGPVNILGNCNVTINQFK